MSCGTLAEIVLQFIEFLELTDDQYLDLHTAVNQQESVWYALRQATPEEQAAVKSAASARLASLLRPPDEDGYSPRVSAQHRSLLEMIASGEAFP
jgi:hypothetical protein